MASVNVLNIPNAVISEAKSKYKERTILFPNPGNGNLNLYCKHYKQLSIRIYNLQGKEVYNVISISNDGFYKVKLPDEMEGIFIVSIEAEGSIQKERIIVNND
jgi:hypothetical protein